MKTLSIAISILLLISFRQVNAASIADYSWSDDAEFIFTGIINQVRYINNDTTEKPFAEISISIRDFHRGNLKNNLITVMATTDLLDEWKNSSSANIGERGMWFVSGVVQNDFSTATGQLVRYRSFTSLDSEPAGKLGLLRHMTTETIQRSVSRDILEYLLGGKSSATLKVELDIQFDSKGKFQSIDITESSGNSLYDDHVFDSIAMLGRDLTFPEEVKEVHVKVHRLRRSRL